MFGYVILHYQNIEITKKCVSLLLDNFPCSPIVIVDNCSPNGSGIELKRMYSSFPYVNVYLNEHNDGFARGNNYGYNILKNAYELDYLVVMNNDILISDSSFEKVISHFMRENNIDVCGPDMITLNNYHQNPLAYHALSSGSIFKTVIFDRIKALCFNSKLLYSMYYKYKTKRGRLIRGKQSSTFQCILHGSCVIFGKKYIKYEKFAFLPITFMYNEEAILFDYLQYKGYKTGYCDQVEILHMEGASTNLELNDNRKKTIIRFKRNSDSLYQQLIQRRKYQNNKLRKTE